MLKQKLNIEKPDLCIEPSAGNGSFINGIKSLFNNCQFYDVEPENNDEIDFRLALVYTSADDSRKKICSTFVSFKSFNGCFYSDCLPLRSLGLLCFSLLDTVYQSDVLAKSSPGSVADARHGGSSVFTILSGFLQSTLASLHSSYLLL